MRRCQNRHSHHPCPHHTPSSLLPVAHFAASVAQDDAVILAIVLSKFCWCQMNQGTPTDGTKYHKTQMMRTSLRTPRKMLRSSMSIDIATSEFELVRY
jgi:hypothetical protein